MPAEGDLQNVASSANDKSASKNISQKASIDQINQDVSIDPKEDPHTRNPQKSVSLKSKFSAMNSSQVDGRSRKKNRVEYTVPYMIKLWEDMEIEYIKNGLTALSALKKQRISVSDNLNLCQK